jgi:acyl carrier protein
VAYDVIQEEISDMTELEADVAHRLESMIKDINLTYRIEEGAQESTRPMNIDSLEFMSLIIEIQRGFGIEIPDAEVQEKNLKVFRNLVRHLAAISEPKP